MSELTIKGLVYVKHGAVGSKSEGPEYHLQSSKSDYRMVLHQRNPWEPDFELEYYSRRIVVVTAEQVEPGLIKVQNISMSPDGLIGQ